MLVFPEGRKGTEKLYKDRYRLRRFGRGGFVEAAMRAQRADRPGRASSGAEEAMPIFAQHRRAAAADRAAVLPDHADVPAPRAARHASATCRPSSASASSSPIPTDDVGDEPWEDRGARPGRRRGGPRAHPGGALSTCSPSASRCGSDDARGAILVTGLSTLLGRPARPGARARPGVETIIGVDTRATRSCELQRTEFVRVGTPARAAAADRRRRRRSTPSSTRGWSSTRRTASARDAHENNVHRHDEHPRGLRRPRLAGPQGRLQVLRALLRLPSRTTRPSSPRTCAARTRRARASRRDIVEAEEAVAAFAARNPDVTVTTLRFANGLGPAIRTSHTALFSLPVDPRDPRLRPALPVHPRGRHRRRARARGAPTTCPASTTPPATACSCSRRSPRCSGKPLAPLLPPWGTGLAAARAARASASSCRPRRCSASCASAAGSTTASSRPPAAARPHDARDRARPSREHLRVAPASGRSAGASYRYEREVEEFLRCSPSVRRRDGDGRAPPSHHRLSASATCRR